MDNTLVPTSAVTILLIQLTKLCRLKINRDYLPLLSVVIAALMNTLMAFGECGFDWINFNVLNHLVQGVIAGFIASGGYDAISSLLNQQGSAENE